MLAPLLLVSALAVGPSPFTTLDELDQAMKAVEQGADAEALWARVKAARAMPLVFGDTAVFLHRARVHRVEWRSDFTDWKASPEAFGRRLGRSDIWTMRRAFVPGTRLDYKIVETEERWLLDPLNPAQQLGGFGPNSVLRMPGESVPPPPPLPPGAARGTLGPVEAVPSRQLGYPVRIRVYRPAGAEGAPLRVLYVTDGSDYWTEGMGNLPATLDALVALGRIPPLLAVFVDPWDANHEENRRGEEFVPSDPGKPFGRCPFCAFLAEELVPHVEGPTPVDPSRRGILGTSLGGLNAAFMGLRYPERFGLLAIQSPWVPEPGWLPDGIARAETQPRRVALDAGLYEERFVAGARLLHASYRRRGVPAKLLEVPDGHSWGHWSATVVPMLEFLYGGP